MVLSGEAPGADPEDGVEEHDGAALEQHAIVSNPIILSYSDI